MRASTPISVTFLLTLPAFSLALPVSFHSDCTASNKQSTLSFLLSLYAPSALPPPPCPSSTPHFPPHHLSDNGRRLEPSLALSIDRPLPSTYLMSLSTSVSTAEAQHVLAPPPSEAQPPLRYAEAEVKTATTSSTLPAAPTSALPALRAQDHARFEATLAMEGRKTEEVPQSLFNTAGHGEWARGNDGSEAVRGRRQRLQAVAAQLPGNMGAGEMNGNATSSAVNASRRTAELFIEPDYSLLIVVGMVVVFVLAVCVAEGLEMGMN